MAYDNWRARLEIATQHSTVAARRAAVSALKINFSQPGEADEGYYRKPVTVKDASGNGRNVITDWIPVAYYMVNDTAWGPPFLGATVGRPENNQELDGKEAADEELWSWVVSNPISEETYRAVAERGEPWPDMVVKDVTDNYTYTFGPAVQTAPDGPVVFAPDPGTKGADDFIFERRPNPILDGNIPAVNRNVALDDNRPPEEPPHVEHGNAIDNAIGAGKDLPVTTAAEAALAAGAANLIRDRRLAAEKAGKLKVDPLKLAYETERDNWLPKIKKAKDAEDAIRKKVSTFEVAERERIAKEQRDAATKLREQEEAAQRVADRAIAAGVPEPAPEAVEEVVIPPAPLPIKPTYGGYRPAAKPLKKFAVITDDVAVYKYFAQTADMKGMLQRFATHAVRQGIEVPGTTTREGTE